MTELEKELEKMRSGKLYVCANEEILSIQARHLELLCDYNATRPSEQYKRRELLEQMFAGVGEGCYIEPPLHANWGGHNVRLGNNVYANFNLTLVDDGEITVGNGVMVGPNVTIATGGHPIAPELRAKGYQYNLPVHIGDNVWIGAGAVILPGVSIGDNTVIGAGSVVTRDIPANSVAVGNPCRVLRAIGEKDYEFYSGNRRIEEDDKVWKHEPQ